MIAALCVGGTFVVVTMVAMQETRRVAGASARMLMAAMTSAFAVGQIVGPLLVSALVKLEGRLTYALITAAVPLLLAAFALTDGRSPAAGAQARWPTRASARLTGIQQGIHSGHPGNSPPTGVIVF